MSKSITISPTLYNLLNEFVGTMERGAEIAEKIKTQAQLEGLSAADTRELVVSFSKKKGITVKPQADTEQKSIDSYVVELPTRDEMPLEDQTAVAPKHNTTYEQREGVVPAGPLGGAPEMAMRKDIQSIVLRPSEYASILAEAIRDDKQIILRVKGNSIVRMDLMH